MADRRMFHRQVVQSDRFLQLPVGAQALYFHLGMEADDDGFVNNANSVAQRIGQSAQEIDLLVSKRFLLDFDGVVVISHWRLANRLRNDRLKPPNFPELARKIYIKDTQVYTKTRIKNGQNLLVLRKNLMQGVDRQMSAECSRREKKRKEKNRIETSESVTLTDNETEHPLPPDKYNQLEIMNGKLGKGVVLLSEEQTEDLLDRLGIDGFDHYVERLAEFILSRNANVRNHYATILKWWEEDRSVNK